MAEWLDRLIGVVLGLGCIFALYFWFSVQVPAQDQRFKEILECMKEAPAHLRARGEKEVFDDCYSQTKSGQRPAPAMREFDPNAGD